MLLHLRLNELVFDPTCWRRNLPHAVEAFWYMAGADPSAVREALSAFERAYPLRQTTPLVRLDARDSDRPFALG